MRSAPRLALVACVIVFAATARADLIFLKDGYVLQGTVRRDVRPEFDPVGRDIMLIPKGFFTIDDGPRRVYFSPSQVRIIESLPQVAEERVVTHAGKMILNPRTLPPHMEVLEEGKWDLKRWERSYAFRSIDAPKVAIVQSLAELRPYYARLDSAFRFRWSAAYLTREFDPATVVDLLRSSPWLVDGPKDKPQQTLTRRLRICDFLAQAGWPDHAEKEFDRLLADFPDQKERVEGGKVQLARLRARDDWEGIKNWFAAGRLDGVRARLAKFDSKHATDRVLADVAEMKGRLAASAELVEEAGKAIDATRIEATSAEGKALAEAAGVIRAELHAATAGRLDAFLGQYRDAQRDKARNKKPSAGPDQLLSLAVSGWLLGSPSAEARSKSALNLWRTRGVVLDNLRDPEATSRRKRLEAYLAQVSPRVDLDEVAQLIGHLPPVEPAPYIGSETREVETGSARRPSTYSVKLPPEYTHNRPYPLLVALHDGGERPAAMIARYEKLAAEHGYVLVAPAWSHKTSNQYHYTDYEHEMVMNAIRDLRRRYQIDTDRVFLTGVGEGGKMAFDFGLQRPDLFAGVLPMAAGPSYFAKRCWRNGHVLPFYVVSGTRGADSQKLLTEVFESWVMRAYPSLWVEYKGRGTEFFPAELPQMFDWMRHQKRAFPLRQLGSDGNGGPLGNEYCTMRAEGNRFYWLEATHVSPRNVVQPDRWEPMTTPAAMTARVEPVTNEITIKTQGILGLTVWFGRDSAGRYLVDFDKPVSIRVGLRGMYNNKVTPSLAVMMDDLYRRGDRKQLVVAKVELTLK